MKELWRYRELFYFLVWRDVKVRYKQTVLGSLWAIIQPTATMVVFTIFFGRLAKMPSDGLPYPLFAYSALLPWTYLATAVGFAGNSLLSNATLIRKVYFPRAAIPASAVLAGLVDLGIASLVLIGLMFYYHVHPGWPLLLWPVLVALTVMLAMGVGMIFAALNAKYRDIKYALPFFIQIWLFVTPIIYPASLVPERFRVWMLANPLVGLIEGFRAALLPGRAMPWGELGISAAATVVILVAGWAYFHRAQRAFADTI